MRAAPAELDNTAGPACDEHFARLSALGHAHINELGRYSFESASPLTADQLRPLRRHSSNEQSLPLLQDEPSGLNPDTSPAPANPHAEPHQHP